MSSNLKVNTILPSTGTNIGIGTAGGTVTIVGDVDIADKIVHTGDTNTSLRFPSADTITAETGGTERIRIGSTGLVSIGDNTNADSQLTITQAQGDCIRLRTSSTNNTFKYGIIKQEPYNNNALGLQIIGGKSDSGYSEISIGGGIDGGYAATQIDFYTGSSTTTATGTKRVRIDSSGRLLIGTTTTYPSNQMLYVKGGSPSTVYDGQVYLEGSETSGAINTGGTLLFGGHDGANARTWGAIRTLKEDGTSGNYGSYMAFLTRPNGSAPTEKVRITSSGKLLIGTTTPGYNDLDDLTIATSGHTGITIRSGTSSLGVIGFADGTSGNAQYRGVIQYSHSGDYMQFNTADAERLRILSTGELGINTTAPVEKLGISGNMRFVNPNGTTSRITALPSGSYNTGTTGGSAVCFQRFADGGGGSDEIFFETHWQGNRHGESMRINKYGHVIKPHQPSFNVTSSGGQINSNVGTIVFTDTASVKNHNTGNHYSTSTGRFTAPVAGRYQINARMLTNSSSNSYTIYLLRVNTSHVGYIGHNHSDYWLMESGSWVLNLAANDYVDCYMQTHSGHLGHNYASFSGFLIG